MPVLPCFIILLSISVGPAFPRALIARGREAVKNSVPWIASLRNDDDGHFCGGSLLRVTPGLNESDIVVTAAHCVMDNSIYEVCLGGHYVNEKIPGEKCVQAAEATMHADYQGCAENDTCEHDIAIVKLQTPIKFSDTIKPIDLPLENDFLPVGSKVIAAGWGVQDDSEDAEASTVLREAHLAIVNNDECAENFEGFIPESMICAGDPAGQENTCEADSGGPLFYKEDGKGPVLYGITSWGAPCLDPSPGAYVRVASYLKWIEATIREVNGDEME